MPIELIETKKLHLTIHTCTTRKERKQTKPHCLYHHMMCMCIREKEKKTERDNKERERERERVRVVEMVHKSSMGGWSGQAAVPRDAERKAQTILC